MTRPIIDDNRLKGMMAFSFEHESNGKNEPESRSWNYFTLSGIYFFNKYLYSQTKIWYGWTGDDNTDLLDYRGYGLMAFNYRSPKDRLGVSFVINPIKNFSVNTQLEISVKLNEKANQFFFVQWYSGYAENLLNYDKYTSMVRAGICIKQPLRNLY